MEGKSSSVECSIMSLPSACMMSTVNFEVSPKSNQLTRCGLESNTVIIDKNTSAILGLSDGPISWAILKLDLHSYQSSFESSVLISKRLVQIVVNEQKINGTSVICEDFLYNLKKIHQNSFYSIIQSKEPFITLTNLSLGHKILPVKATKVKLSLFKCQTYLEDWFIDKILQKYFSCSIYFCTGDVFGVHLDEPQIIHLMFNLTVDTVYFQILELEGPQMNCSQYPDTSIGYVIDSSVIIYQVSNYQDFLPPRKIPVFYDLNFSSLLSIDKFMEYSHRQNLLPPSFDEIYNVLLHWISPFFDHLQTIQNVELKPIFVLCGQNGIGKTYVLQALSQYFGVNYLRIDCVTVGGMTSGNVEGKIKAIFNQLKFQVPCLLQLSNIEALYQDADLKTNIRIISSFEQQVKLLKFKFPVIIIATTSSKKCINSTMHHIFLDMLTLRSPNCEQREQIISWLIHYNGGSIDLETLQSVASETAGFVFRDLQTVVASAFKEKYRRSDDVGKVKFHMSDFSKFIGSMHKAYSDSIGAPKVPSVAWQDVGGLEHLKKEILQSLRSGVFNTGLRRSGLLLHGPPGTGKTLLAKAVATHCSRNFLSVKGPELLNMYVGQSERNVRDLFELAKVASPCIIFFDELDSLAPKRGQSGDSGGVMDRVVSQLLAEMDDLGNSGDIFIIGATNRLDLIDTALLRPGRLDKQLFVGLCTDRSSQLRVITMLTLKLCMGPDVNLENIVTMLPASVSGAQLSALCSAAWLTSARELIQSKDPKSQASVIVNQGHFLSALGTVFRIAL